MLVRFGSLARHGLRLALAISVVTLAFGSAAVFATDNDQNQSVHQWDAELAGLPPKVEKHKHPMIKLVKGVGKEFESDISNVARDSVFVFSAQGIDPFDGKTPPKDQPYTLATFNLVDGSEGRLVKYPDGSGRAFGGFIDGTILIPDGDHRWIVKYPNGVQGLLKRSAEGNLEVLRPDKTITTFTRQADGSYSIANDHIGYMGEINPEGYGYSFLLH
jgi:hypothetical protein